MSNVIAQLKQMKRSPEAGAASASLKGAGRDALMQAIGHQDVTPNRLSVGDVFLFYRWNVSQFVSMPATVTASLLVVVFGGWMTTVSAASSLPGDTLYGLKLVTERAQLSIASLEHKAVLHTEFAERRLEEAVALESSTDPERASYVNTALHAFARELSLAEGNLRQLKEEGNLGTIQVATTVDQKIGALNSVIDKRVEGEHPEANAVEEVRDITRQASNSVVDVIVETHEASLDPVGTTQDLHALFKVKLRDIQSRKALDLGRVVVIEQVAVEQGLAVNMLAAKNEIADSMVLVPEAETLSAAGGYRAAFDLLREAESGLMAAEAMITETELWIIEQMNAPVLEEPAAEGTELSESTIDSEDSATDT